MNMRSVCLFVALISCPVMAETTTANPIRKVVNMLQLMQGRITEEGTKERALYEKFMCYCKTGVDTLKAGIEEAQTKIPDLESSIKEAAGQKAQLKEELAQHQADRDAAKQAIAEATAIRQREKAAFDALKTDSDANIDAVNKAIAALSAGMAGSFLQTTAAGSLRRLVVSKEDMLDVDRNDLLAFLSTTQGSRYAPQSGQIVGILKQMADEMTAGSAEAVATEEAAAHAFAGLIAAKKKFIAAVTKSIEEKLKRSGDIAAETAQAKNELEDTQEALAEDTKFLADLEKNCATKTADWEARSRTRNEELLALAETIKVLNDDDALELFKKTLPSAGASLLQVQVSSSMVRAKGAAVLKMLQANARFNRPQLDFVLLAINGKKCGFTEIVKMIDELVATLKTEQADDDAKKEYCAVQFDTSDDKKKALEQSIADIETAIAKAEEGIAALTEAIKALVAGITALDASVAEATEQRKEEHEDFNELMASDSTAKELLNFAKNRLNKFYNPQLYKPPPAQQLSEEDRITVNMGGTLAPTTPGGIADTGIGFVQLTMDEQKDAPAPPPETYGEFKKKTEESTGVLAMIDLLIQDLDKEMTVAATEEKNSQAAYEQFIADAAEKRAGDSKATTEKRATLADMKAGLEDNTEAKASTSKELAITLQYIHSLHAECDWLVKYFDVRKEARTSEIDSLGNARSVLSGADYSLLQVESRTALRRR